VRFPFYFVAKPSSGAPQGLIARLLGAGGCTYIPLQTRIKKKKKEKTNNVLMPQGGW
jgi:hypothetical protein